MKKNITQRKVERALQEVRDKYNVHGRAFNGRDFYRICKGENIGLMNKRFFPENLWSLYQNVNGLQGFLMQIHAWRFIYLQSFFVGRFDTMTAFHELGHHFLGHVSGEKRSDAGAFNMDSFDYDVYLNSPHETDAELFAELATGRKVRRSSNA
jgi:hypothetical protein